MTAKVRKIPFEIRVGRIIELLATQIYQSPLALLRENAQNAYDAVLMRLATGGDFSPRIELLIEPGQVRVSDNGIGMTPEQLIANYWTGGSSGKNNPEARAAGVVGTFGIGAMANFGIASYIEVETEAASGTRTRSSVERANLSTSEDCIVVEPLPPTGQPGTSVLARFEPGAELSIDEAVDYIAAFVEFVSIPVWVNGTLRSGRQIRDSIPSSRGAWQATSAQTMLGGLVSADAKITGLADGSILLVLENMRTEPEAGRPGSAALSNGGGAIRTLRSGFGLATVAVPSEYGWGGVIDLPVLEPTAGREALSAESNDLLQRIFRGIDDLVSEHAVGHPEALENQAFLSWISRHGRYDACGPMLVRVEPGSHERALETLKDSSPRYYTGTDASLISALASEDQPLVVVSRRSPRRDCEIGYLRTIAADEVRDQPQVVERIDSRTLSVAHGAVAIRVARVLEEDYFVEVPVHYARMSHNVPLMLETKPSTTLYLDPDATALQPLLELYVAEFGSFGPFVKDFIRAHVFPKIAPLVPSSTREGAEAFLRRLRNKRELFEIDWTDREDLQALWDKYAMGEIGLSEVARESISRAARSVVVVQRAAEITSVVPDIEDSQPEIQESFEPLPPVDRRESSTDALVLAGERALNGYTCFVALSEKAEQRYGEFFLQPHTTAVVWGGQKILFVFEHHSREFGLYYDVQCPGLVDATSGGGRYRTSTLLMKDRVFIPVPTPIATNFIPTEGERIRLEVRVDVLYLDAGPAGQQ